MDAKLISDSKDAGSTGVFNRVLDGKELNFFYEKGSINDSETKSKCNVLGKAVEGKYTGRSLNKISHGDYFAFAWFAFMPNTKIYTGE